MADKAWSQLWGEYKSQGSLTAKEELIANYAFLVRHVVARLMIGLPPHVEAEEMLSYATLGLLEAMERYDPERGIRFESYAVSRIKGAILDGLRANDWVPRVTRQRIKEMERAYLTLQQTLGREPSDEEMSEALELSLADFHKLQYSASATVVFSLDEGITVKEGEILTRGSMVEDPHAQVDVELMQDDEKHMLAQGIAALPERERILVSLYYYEGLTLKEVGMALGVTESRASQMHSKAILRLRAFLQEALNK
ncbi:MAG: FliA/WhiG family RNA polymerase sigma factor [Symbiobacteriaceae bacterium]|nr:FliA/WhiG family RNA polymerase sigma factor [Symbiobacteriaceae bacterium]